MAARPPRGYGCRNNGGVVVLEYLIVAGVLYLGYRLWQARLVVPKGPVPTTEEAASSERFVLYYLCDQARFSYSYSGMPEVFRGFDTGRPPFAFQQSILVALGNYLWFVEGRDRTERDYDLALANVRLALRNGIKRSRGDVEAFKASANAAFEERFGRPFEAVASEIDAAVLERMDGEMENRRMSPS
ncbi:hypothetical protein ACFOWB_13295 [Chenggangzhangella methanolivorans]|uniref:hypothetical protein n=1 Tax=Chenggangzhangella methanolivorans TaxID=1437009 RepID=UPI00360904CB